MNKRYLLIVVLALAGCQTSPVATLKKKAVVDNTPPMACKALKAHMDNGYWRVKHRENALLVIKNISKQPVLVDRYVKDPGADAGWASMLSPSHYSAMHFNEPVFDFRCSDVNKTQYTEVACNKVLKMYWLGVSVHSPELLNGGYWIAENVTKANLFHRILDKGFLINPRKEDL